MDTVEIAGGGIAGLAAATALARRGWKVRVHERAPELRGEGSAIGLGQNAIWALETIGCVDATQQAVEASGYQIRDERGRLMLNGTHAYAYLGRKDLTVALAAAATAAGADIVLGSPVSGADANGALLLEGGRRMRADLVLGADGVRSRVRDTVLDASVRRLPFVEMRDNLPDEAPGIPGGVIIEHLSGPLRLGVFNYHGVCHVYYSCPIRDVGPGEWFDADRWRAAFPRLRAVVDKIAANGVTALHIDEVRCEQWSRGRVAVVGDAGHAMSPFLGQAGCLAMQSAVSLAEELGDAGRLRDDAALAAALSAWQRRMTAVVTPTQTFARRLARASWGWPRPLLALRTPVMRRVYRHGDVLGKIDGKMAVTAVRASSPVSPVAA